MINKVCSVKNNTNNNNNNNYLNNFQLCLIIVPTRGFFYSTSSI